MGWFSPVKGSYPSLAQVDKTLPMGSADTTVERGNILTMAADADGNPVWGLAAKNSGTFYVALTGTTDPTAGFAGSAFDPAGGVAAITGIDLAQDGEYETSVFKADDTYTIGAKLYVVNGVLQATDPGSGVAVGIVTATPKSRWVNNAIAVPEQKNGVKTDPRLAIRTGNRLSVIRFKTAL